jgi:hypothetical protein
MTVEAGAPALVEREVTINGAEAETNMLAARLGTVYAEHAKYYARQHAGEKPPAVMVDEFYDHMRELAAVTMPPEKVHWSHLAALAQGDQRGAFDLWEKIKQYAREELATGTRVVEAIGPRAEPLERARLFAVRAELIDGWQPQNGIEHTLIDMLAAAYSLWLHWTEIAHSWATGFINDSIEKGHPTLGLAWRPPSIDTSEAVERAHRLADSYNRQFLRVLRQMRDLRRYAPPVIVNNGGQVNVGQQQVNVAQPASGTNNGRF